MFAERSSADNDWNKQQKNLQVIYLWRDNEDGSLNFSVYFLADIFYMKIVGKIKLILYLYFSDQKIISFEGSN